MSTAEHRQQAAGKRALCAVLTISDTRTKETDKGGRVIIENLEAAGHMIGDYAIVKDDAQQIEAQLRAWLGENRFDVICTTGGTGISSRDTTIEVVARLLDKQLDGFGELFRMLSWDEVGAAAMLSRAIGGLAGETLLFAMPGSTNAVKLAMEKLIVPELPHLIWERSR
ncbi:MAG: molybdenum cofactor biosynthesis protein B [Phycisphaeraceae bacterium]